MREISQARAARSGETPIVGVVHLLPLPGSPRASLNLEQIIERAVDDARAYEAGGASALIVENYGDAPFRKDRVEPYTIAALTRVVTAVRAAVRLPVGVNVLRNDAVAALSIAAATGASFIRVNVHTGAMLTDQGIIEGRADETLRLRRFLDAPVEIWADILVKHAAPLGPVSLEEAARDALERGLADALILTGSATGQPADPEELRRLRALFPEVPIFIGSGITPERVAAFLPETSGFIVGTWAKEEGIIENRVSRSRVEMLARAIRTAAQSSPGGNRARRV
ncbi:BtpA/SgcQ family protein [Thermomicrobiaceae bacterium CFH 74404]|uniref:BtpA/SgcQ family protein n=1 Tax=Thermalbibacter longus TaxID=2951981 RepID=A0AA41WD45_9BACT|nr:BtpA/SgcQ family protein [Thermalbibacter longus]MCM8748868.1 BtpA/SgcQ family protein [Thermalbibacter longus]